MPKLQTRIHFILRRTLEKTRAALPILFLFAFLLIIDGLFIYILDSTFKADKKELISTTQKFYGLNDRFIKELSNQLDGLVEQSPDHVQSPNNAADVIRKLAAASETERGKWESNLKQFIHAPDAATGFEHPIYMIRIYAKPESGDQDFNNVAIVVRDDEKFDRLNGWEYSLVSRKFTGVISTATIGSFDAEISYTNYPSLEFRTLAWWYRAYALIFVGSTLVIFIFMLRKALLPMHRVAVKLEFMQRQRVETIPAPSTRVERAYNALAQNTQILNIGRALEKLALPSDAESEPMDPWLRIGRSAPDIVSASIALPALAVYAADPAGHPAKLIEQRGTLPDGPLPEDAFRQAASSRQAVYAAAWQAWIAPISFNEKVHGFLVVREPDSSGIARSLCEGIASQIENTLLRMAQQQILIDREKNEISINLCTNMGHDLTNVIATSKWDIDTIRRALEQHMLAMKDDRLSPLLERSVEGLLNNTRFLQEIVEIYRAFGYTKRPEYTSVDVGDLMQEVVSLFELSSTRDCTFQVEKNGALPPVMLEPRLMKLALFNLLANASQAITRRRITQPENANSGAIILAATVEDNNLILRVQDNGTGFRHPSGEFMSEQEIQRVFAYGFSTRDDRKGGTGIGLSWVRTIIEEYHAGSVTPRNRPEGGAEMRVEIPLNLMDKLN